MSGIEWIAALAIAYLLIPFLIAYVGDSDSAWVPFRKNNHVIYALSLAVYCSSWTFYGAVGTATVRGLDYLAIYLGPCLMLMFGFPLLQRMILICKQHNITTVSDFIASRFGKSRRIGVLVTFIAVMGSLPYIALQLQAVSQSYLLLHQASSPASGFNLNADEVALFTGVILALFAVLFGTRHLDATEHHRGMVLAIAFESTVKLVAIVAIGYYAYFLLFDGSIQNRPEVLGSVTSRFTEDESSWSSFLTRTLLSIGAIMLLPRQFQVTVVEADNAQQIRTAAWLVPVYMLITSVIVIPIALAGSTLLPDGNADLYVLTLPLSAGNTVLGVVAFIGGLSAATGMVIVSVISLSTMISNDWVMPRLIRARAKASAVTRLETVVLLVRRLSIIAVIGGAYVYFLLMDSNAQLANIGLTSFAAIFLLLPATLAAFFWKRAHSRGVFWGLMVGFVVWLYTLFLPTVLTPDTVNELVGVSAWLHPQRLFMLDLGEPLTHGVIWSTALNVITLVLVSLRENQSTLERMQALRFAYLPSVVEEPQKSVTEPLSVHPDVLRLLAEGVIGERNTQKVIAEYESQTGKSVAHAAQIDSRLLTMVQTAIAGVIGSASAQRVIADAITGDEEHLEEVSVLVDESSSILRFNRKLLETTLQNITHGIAVVDRDLNLVIWNDRYLKLFDYPENLIYIGKPLREMLEFNAKRGDFGEKDPAYEVDKRLAYLRKGERHQSTRERSNGVIIKSSGEPLPGGGFVTTYEDITESVRAAKMLRQANEELEDRVLQRTRELHALTQELERNTRSKTHFLAAASHDLLQPINAARLFNQSVLESSGNAFEVERLSVLTDQSLGNADKLLRALLDISKLDAGGIKPEPRNFSVRRQINGLVNELTITASNAGMQLDNRVGEEWVYTDSKLLRSVLQNLIGNAIRYTPHGGRVTLSCQRTDDAKLRISVADTGQGIDQQHLERIFEEFYQIKGAKQDGDQGLGLGLSIVKRICDLIDARLEVESAVGEGSCFSVTVPLGEVEEALAAVTQSEPLSAQPDLSLRGRKVLCLENDPAVLQAMQNLLSGWGCEVLSSADPEEAWNLVLAGGIEVVLADYQLDAALSGLDVLRRAAEIAAPDLRGGVLITAEQNPELATQVEDIGYYFLAKPVDPKALKSILQLLLS